MSGRPCEVIYKDCDIQNKHLIYITQHLCDW